MGRKVILGAALAALIASSAAGQNLLPSQPGIETLQGHPTPVILFISPAGEPFRGAADMTLDMKAWFDQADANHDNGLSLAEFTDDHMRFYKALDELGDGVVDAFDVSRYERAVAPEITGYDAHGAKLGPIGPRGLASRAQPRIKRGTPPPAREGAAQFSVLGELEPVRAADADFDFKISGSEWTAAAARRFAALDADHNGRIELKELHLPPEPWAYGERSLFHNCFNCEYIPLYQWPY